MQGARLSLSEQPAEAGGHSALQSGPGLKAGHESRGLRTCSSLCSTFKLKFCFLASISSDALTRPPSAFSFQVARWYRAICFIFSVSYVVNVATLVPSL